MKVNELNKISLSLNGATFIRDDIVHFDTVAHWNTQRDLVAKNGHIYVYTDYQVIDGVNIPAIKIGDGNAYLIDIPFVDSNSSLLKTHIDDKEIHITSDERDFWNNKVTAFISSDDEKTLVLSKEREEKQNG